MNDAAKMTKTHHHTSPFYQKQRKRCPPTARKVLHVDVRRGVFTTKMVLFGTYARYLHAIKAGISIASYIDLHASRTRGQTILECIVILLHLYFLDASAHARKGTF